MSERGLDVYVVGNVLDGNARILPADILPVAGANDARGKQFHPATDERDISPPDQKIPLTLKPGRMHDVVGVHSGDEGRFGAGNTAVESGNEAHAAGAEHTDATVSGADSGEAFERPVTRTIVDRDQFE